MINVTETTKTFRTLLRDINVDVVNMGIKHMGGSQFEINFDTKQGSYGSFCEIKSTRAKTDIVIQNHILFSEIKFNGLIHDCIFPVIMEMSEHKDSAVELLFENLCLFWDEVFVRAYGDIDSRLNYAVMSFDKNMRDITGLYKSIYRNPRMLKWFVTSSIGNYIYYNGGLATRKDITREIRGAIF